MHLLEMGLVNLLPLRVWLETSNRIFLIVFFISGESFPFDKQSEQDKAHKCIRNI